jgi:DNA-directed RNA polymerase I, II, and III subunit RPABC2
MRFFVSWPVACQTEDEEDDYDENYLQKFDSEITKNYITDFHPECLNHNYDEITKLSTVVRNSDNIIIDPLHRTIPFLTKYEKARILGQRAKQIETGSKPFVKIPENIVDSYIIAELELREKKIPFIIKRPIPSGGFEYWHLKDLEIIGF